MGVPEVIAAAEKPRLSYRDRWILVAITFMSFAAAAAAFLSALEASLAFFGEQPTARENAVADKSMLVFLWAVVTPPCCWAVLRGGRRGAAGVLGWLLLAASCQWWWWPGPPADGFDRQVRPVWAGPWAVAPWALVGASLLVGTFAAWRSGRWVARVAGLIVATGVLAGAALSYNHLLEQARAELPSPIASKSHELDALRNDPIWAALPDASITDEGESPATVELSGEEFPTWKKVTLGTTQDLALFESAVSAADSTSWTLSSSTCSEHLIEASFAKTLSSGRPATLRISMASYQEGVELFSMLGGPDVLSSPMPTIGSVGVDRCWEQL